MKSALVLVMLLCATPLLAQEETLLGSNKIEHGGYGALVTKFTSVNGRFGVLLGGRGGWIINHSFALGLAGYGLVNNVPAHNPGPLGEPYLNLGYGGLDLEYIYRSNDIVHVSVHTLIGAGAAGYRYGILANDGSRPGFDWNFPWDSAWNQRWDNGSGWSRHWDTFFIIEPGANLDVNITSWFRTSFGASFRIVRGLASSASSNRDLSGPSGMITFRFGSF